MIDYHPPQSNTFIEITLVNARHISGPLRAIVDDDHVLLGFVTKGGSFYPITAVLEAIPVDLGDMPDE